MGETCAKCGRKLIEVTRFYEFENKNYCNHCVTQCERCNKLIHLDEAHQLDNHYVCDECFELGLVVCHDCQDIICEDNSYYIESDYHVCRYCYEDGYFSCDSCFSNYSQDELHQDENGDCFCECCFEERELKKSPYINHYDYDPVKATDFSNDRYDNMYIGVELELENKDNKIQSTKAMARRTGEEHPQMLYSANGYVVAWFMWQLQGDKYAEKAFIGDNPELLTNHLYQNQQINIEN